MLSASKSVAAVTFKQFRLCSRFSSNGQISSIKVVQRDEKLSTIAFPINFLPGRLATRADKQKMIDNIVQTREKRQKRFEQVKARVENQDVAIRDEILSFSLLQLRDALQKDEFNAQTVLMAYAWKAMKVQDKFNCLCEFLIESFEEAENLDKLYSGVSDKPPLYGIPYSVKSGFFIKGYDCTAGLARRVGSPKKVDCSFVSCLRSLGAIPFVYTNVPQLLLSFFCSNPVFGATLHPMNPHRSPGGTSGGEACLLAAGGTPFGIGNDLGGSMRIPSSFCGVVTMKPTESRYLVINTFNLPGRGRISLSNGFFTKSVDEQVLLWECTLAAPENYVNAEPRNVLKVPFKLSAFKETVAKKTLRIGYFTNDGFTRSTPGCERVVQETVSKLREQGHELVEFRIPSVERAISAFSRCVLPDGGVSLLKIVDNDLMDPHLEESASLVRTPLFIRKIARFFLRNISPQWSSVLEPYVQTAEDVIRAQADCDNYIKQFTNYYCGLDLDALICPSFPVPAVPHEYACRLSGCVFATGLFSLLDYPVGVVPTGKVTAKDDVYLQDENKWPTGNNLFLKSMRAATVNSVGLPLAVQVVAMPYQEEKCLGVMKVIEDLWK